VLDLMSKLRASLEQGVAKKSGRKRAAPTRARRTKKTA